MRHSLPLSVSGCWTENTKLFSKRGAESSRSAWAASLVVISLFSCYVITPSSLAESKFSFATGLAVWICFATDDNGPSKKLHAASPQRYPQSDPTDWGGQQSGAGEGKLWKRTGMCRRRSVDFEWLVSNNVIPMKAWGKRSRLCNLWEDDCNVILFASRLWTVCCSASTHTGHTQSNPLTKEHYPCMYYYRYNIFFFPSFDALC